MRNLTEYPITLDEITHTLEDAARQLGHDPNTGEPLIGGIQPMVLQDLAKAMRAKPHLLEEMLEDDKWRYRIETPSGAMGTAPDVGLSRNCP